MIKINVFSGRVGEVITGKNGQIRLVRVNTAKGSLLRPIQRLYPLECDLDKPVVNDNDLSELGSFEKWAKGILAQIFGSCIHIM